MSDESKDRPAWRSRHPAIRWGTYAWALVGFGIAFILLWRALGYVRIVVVPLSLALFPAAILTPVASWLEDRGWPAALAAFAVLLAFVAALGGIFALIGVQIQAELSGLVDQLRSSYEAIRPQIAELPLLPDPEALFRGRSDGASAEAALGAAIATVAVVTQFFIFLVASFFFIKDRHLISSWLVRLFPRSTWGEAEDLGERMWATVGGYIRGQAIIATFDGVLVAIGLLLLGIPLAMVLGAIVFFGAFAPVVGSIAAGTVAVAVALVSQGLVKALITLAIIVGVQQLEGNVLAPVILGREVELHPLVILLAITVGAVLLGPWGAVIGVPLAASVYRASSFLRQDVEGAH